MCMNLLMIYFLGSLYKMADRLLPWSRELVSKPKFSSFATSLDINNVGKQSLFLFYWHIVESLFFSVPVFDTRGKNLFILPTDVQGISDILLAFHGEPPKELIIQVGYTVNSYKGSKNPEDLNISFNLLFIIVLATDGKTIPLVLYSLCYFIYLINLCSE
jgi:hypothetical protein